MPTINDKRTDEDRATHPILIVGTDRFMSGWGGASNGASYAAWACRPEHADRVLSWVEARSEMSRVREVSANYRPSSRYCAHLSIYVVDDGHPVLS